MLVVEVVKEGEFGSCGQETGEVLILEKSFEGFHKAWSCRMAPLQRTQSVKILWESYSGG